MYVAAICFEAFFVSRQVNDTYNFIKIILRHSGSIERYKKIPRPPVEKRDKPMAVMMGGNRMERQKEDDGRPLYVVLSAHWVESQFRFDVM